MESVRPIFTTNGLTRDEVEEMGVIGSSLELSVDPFRNTCVSVVGPTATKYVTLCRYWEWVGGQSRKFVIFRGDTKVRNETTTARNG